MIGRPAHVMQLISSLEAGGSEKLLLSFLAACRDDDRLNPVVVVMNQQVNPDMRDELDRLAYPVYYLDRPEGHLHPRYLLALMRIIHRHEIEIIHAHNTGSKLWGGLCKAMKPSLDLVFTIHDTLSIPRLGCLQLCLHRYWIDENIAISKTIASACERRSITNVRQIYNGIPLHRFANPGRIGLQERVRRVSYEDRPLRILHVGRMDARVKGQDVLIRAVRLCRDNGLKIQATLMGGVYDYNVRAYESLQFLVKELDLENEISFRINRTDVPQALNEADLFVMPSRFEGLGLAILEAMSSGVSVIASDIEGPRELVEDGVNGLLFKAEDPGDLFLKISQVYNRPAAADRMRVRAMDYVRRFDIGLMQEAYYELYNDLSSGEADWPKDFRRLSDGTSF